MTDTDHIEHPEKLKVVELKEELEKRGLDTKGLKKDLVARLEAAQADSMTTQQTDSSSDAKDAKDQNAGTTADEPIDGEGAGHTMVEGSPERTAEIRQLESEAVASEHETKEIVSVEPAALDDEVARVIAEEEAKDDLPASPGGMRAISPMPFVPSRAGSPGVEAGVEIGAGDLDEEKGTDKDAEEVKESGNKGIADQPVALDEQFAEVIAEEERKEVQDAANEGRQETSGRISPLPPSRERSPPRGAQNDRGVETPPMPARVIPVEHNNDNDVDDDDVMDLDDIVDESAPAPAIDTAQQQGDSSNKRDRIEEENSIPAPKRPRAKQTEQIPLPDSLSHLIHPPTSTLYITELRRPLLLPDLHAYIYQPEISSASSDARLPEPRLPFASSDQPGLWLSGIKSHAYATFSSVAAAVKTAERIEGKTWPEETGGKIHVEFVDDDAVRDLVDQEELAWKNGRQKLNLVISKAEDGQVKFEFKGAGSMGPAPTRAGRPTSGSGFGHGPGHGGRGEAQGQGQGQGAMHDRRPMNGFEARGLASRGPPLSGSNGLMPPRNDRNGYGGQPVAAGPSSMSGSQSRSDGRDAPNTRSTEHSSMPSGPASGNGASGPGPGPRAGHNDRGLPPHMSTERARSNGYPSGSGGGRGGDSYRDGDRQRDTRDRDRDRDRDLDRNRQYDRRNGGFRDNRDRERSPPRRYGAGGGGGDSWRAGDALGKRETRSDDSGSEGRGGGGGGGGGGEKRTRISPALSWTEGPGAK